MASDVCFNKTYQQLLRKQNIVLSNFVLTKTLFRGIVNEQITLLLILTL